MVFLDYPDVSKRKFLKMKINILDCTFRDEGYYNNWNFSNEEFDNYIAITNNLPIDYIEIGYLNVKKIMATLADFFI